MDEYLSDWTPEGMPEPWGLASDAPKDGARPEDRAAPSPPASGAASATEYAARRASKAIFVTSLTTAIAFAATAMSKVMPISAFGALSAIMIFALFALNVLFFPPALVMYDRWVERAKARAARRANGRQPFAADDASVESGSSGDVAVELHVDV